MNPSVSSSQTPTYQRHLGDIFEHILFFINLAVLGSAITLTLGYFIDKWLPSLSDTSSSITQINFLQSALSTGIGTDITGFDPQDPTLLRIYLALLFVSLPLFVLFFLHIIIRSMKRPEIKTLFLRKLCIYSTLGITFLIVQYSLISFIFNLLNGNITWNITLHFLVDLLVNGSIFTYFFFSIRHDIKDA